jgi:DNA-binding NarL/FixJ family response regulator
MLGHDSHFVSDEGNAKNSKTVGGSIKSNMERSSEPLGTALSSASVIIIEKRDLIRSCLERGISELSGCPVASFPSIEGWRKAAAEINALIIVVGWAESGCECSEDFDQLGSDAPFLVLSDAPGLADIEKSLRCGARGHVSFNVALDVVIEAIRLVLAGGIFIPPEILFEASAEGGRVGAHSTPFTRREEVVIDALRKGKPNKVIAHELSLSESTVKLHVRNIMKKMHAKNRTEVAIRLM